MLKLNQTTFAACLRVCPHVETRCVVSVIISSLLRGVITARSLPAC